MDRANKESDNAFTMLASYESHFDNMGYTCQAAKDKRIELRAQVVSKLGMNEKVVEVEAVSNAFGQLAIAEVQLYKFEKNTPETEHNYNIRLGGLREAVVNMRAIVMMVAEDNQRSVKRARIASPEPAAGGADKSVDLTQND